MISKASFKLIVKSFTRSDMSNRNGLSCLIYAISNAILHVPKFEMMRPYAFEFFTA